MGGPLPVCSRCRWVRCGGRLEKEAEGNRAKLTDAFLELKFIEALGNNTKVFFGNQVSPAPLPPLSLLFFFSFMFFKDLSKRKCRRATVKQSLQMLAG